MNRPLTPDEVERKDAIAERYYKALAEWKATAAALAQEFKRLTCKPQDCN